MTNIKPSQDNQILIQDLRQIIDQARGHVAATANYVPTMMYWHFGERINRDVLGDERAEYGKQIVAQVAQQLQTEYGKKGFEERTIRRMMQFAQMFPDFQIVSPLVSKYMTELPPCEALQRQIQKSLEMAKARFENYMEEDEE